MREYRKGEHRVKMGRGGEECIQSSDKRQRRMKRRNKSK